MVPIVPEPLPPLAGTAVFMSNGRTDSLIPAAEAERLALLLQQSGATVDVEWQPGGHQLTRQDLVQARLWYLSRWT
jgi:phospholipase/carboxylesterase